MGFILLPPGSGFRTYFVPWGAREIRSFKKFTGGLPWSVCVCVCWGGGGGGGWSGLELTDT